MQAYSVSEEKLKRLVSQVGRRLIEAYFDDGRTHIGGEEILNFSPFQQINRFILFQIFQEWNIYVAKLTHPYFDFKHEEVKEALVAFQNILSKHILVEKNDFIALAEKSAYNTLKLLLNPTETFINFFFLNKETLPLSLFEKYANYFYEYDFIVNGVLEYHKKNGLHKIDKSVFLQKVAKIVEIYERKTGRSIETYRKDAFSVIAGVSFDDFNETPETRRPFSEAGFEEQPKSANFEVHELSQESVPPPTHRTYAAPNDLKTNFETQQPPRLSEKFVTPTIPSVMQTNHNDAQPIHLEKIPIHKQFQYIQKVFSGKQELFRVTIEQINGILTYEEAEQYLRVRIFNMPDVSVEDKITQEFLQIVKKRYNLN